MSARRCSGTSGWLERRGVTTVRETSRASARLDGRNAHRTRAGAMEADGDSPLSASHRFDLEARIPTQVRCRRIVGQLRGRDQRGRRREWRDAAADKSRRRLHLHHRSRRILPDQARRRRCLGSGKQQRRQFAEPGGDEEAAADGERQRGQGQSGMTERRNGQTRTPVASAHGSLADRVPTSRAAAARLVRSGVAWQRVTAGRARHRGPRSRRSLARPATAAPTPA